MPNKTHTRHDISADIIRKGMGSTPGTQISRAEPCMVLVLNPVTSAVAAWSPLPVYAHAFIRVKLQGRPVLPAKARSRSIAS
jgi:hypothetical protein